MTFDPAGDLARHVLFQADYADGSTDVFAVPGRRCCKDHRLGVAEGRLLETGRHRQRAAQALNRVRPAPNVAGERGAIT